MIVSLPYLTVDLPGIGGQIKTVPGDFYVEEIPLYEASGEGQHIYLTLEKKGDSHPESCQSHRQSVENASQKNWLRGDEGCSSRYQANHFN